MTTSQLNEDPDVNHPPMPADRKLSFSVVITNYNYGKFLPEAIDSALNQSLTPLEIIVVDDGSTDDSCDVVATRYGQHPLLKLVRQSNRGQLAAFQTGIASVRGDIVALLDADDIWEPHYLERVAEVYARAPSPDFVYTNMSFFGARSGTVLTDQRAGDLGLSVLLGAFNTIWQGAPTSGNSLRRELAVRLTRLPDTIIEAWRTRADDCIVCGADILGARKYHLPEALVRYRTHEQNAWLGKKQDPVASLRHWMRVETMLEHYRQTIGANRRWLRFVKHEFRTKTAPGYREFGVYWDLVGMSDLSLIKRIEARAAIFAHFIGFKYRKNR